MMKNIFIGLIMLSLLASCASREKIVYFQNGEGSKEMTSNFEPKIKTDDLLMVIVSARDPEAAVAFNLPLASVMGNGNQISGQQQFQLYLVDNQGNIEFPILGTLKAGGLTKSELKEQLKNSLKKYITDPILNIRIMNYKISVNGEVVRPGSYPIVSERVTLPDALAMAGDMTIYGRRDNVIILREVDGVKTVNRVDMTKADFINSEFYYLSQNDVVYVEPNKTKINSSVIGPNASIIISSISLLITVTALLIK